MSHLDDALAAATDTKALRIERGAINEVADLFMAEFPNCNAVIVADVNTYRAAGDAVYRILAEHNIQQLQPFIFQETDLYADFQYVEQLVSFLKSREVIPLAVGSGTINDVTKLASFLTDRRYMCVATAASMDGYTAYGASISFEGAKKTFDCPAPLVCLADIDVIANAPKAMTAAGYADLFAKITAGADWILADRLNIEEIDKKSWSIVNDQLHLAISDPEGVRKGDVEAITRLTEGLMLGGFAMQSLKSSRPASGGEHQFSHLWNMENHLFNGKHVPHGFQVSIGTLAVIALYEKFVDSDFKHIDVESALENWPSREVLSDRARTIFKDTDFPDIGLVEAGAKYVDHEQLSERLALLIEREGGLKAALKKQLVSFEEAKRRLEMVGAPVQPEEIGLTKERLKHSYRRAQYIRRRFTILDLAIEAGLFDKWVDEIFSPDGPWG